MKKTFIFFLLLLASVNMFTQSLPRMKDPYVDMHFNVNK